MMARMRPAVLCGLAAAIRGFPGSMVALEAGSHNRRRAASRPRLAQTTLLMTALQASALTDFLLACLSFFCAGALIARPAQPFSAAWYWRGAMLLLALAAMLGGVDHGFVQPTGLPRAGLQRATWALLGLMTTLLLLSLGAQFLAAAPRRVLDGVALVQLLVFAAATLVVDSFIVAVVNYVPVVLALLVFNLAGLRRGEGSPAIVVGLCVLMLASVVQALQIDHFAPIGPDAMYHLISMPGVWLLYIGGRSLKTQP